MNRWRSAIVVLPALLLAACGGIPADEDPTVLAGDQLPPELAESTTSTVAAGNLDVTVFLIDAPEGEDDQLGLCATRVDAFAATARQALAALEALIELVPTESVTCPSRYINAIPPDLVLRSASMDDRILVLDLANLSEIQGVAARRAIAQIVFTATDLPGIDGVRFRENGKDVAVNVSEGRTLGEGEAVYPTDFPRFADQIATTSP